VNPCARGANLGDQVVMAWSLKDANGELVHFAPQRLGHQSKIDSGRDRNVYHASAFGPNDKLFHVAIGSVHERAFTLNTRREDCDGVLSSVGTQVCAFERVNRNLDFCPFSVSDLFANVEHWSFVSFAFADHDGALHRQ
jgi:hypothetical protein